tara:strand:- start:68 stop:556 length:489 start_codon:yes stop_codon:yes gene_type:complete
MKKILFLFPVLFLLNGCVESVALLGSTAGGASSGRLIQSSLQSTISYGIKKQTGKTPLGHALAYAEKNNPDKKKETCISFIEKTRSEFCSIAKKKISTTNQIVKDKIVSKIRKDNKDTNLYTVNKSNQTKKTPRELAIDFQNELIKKTKDKYQSIKFYLVSR